MMEARSFLRKAHRNANAVTLKFALRFAGAPSGSWLLTMPTWTPSSARELGKRRLERIPVQETAPDRSLGDRAAWTPDLVSIPQKAWQTAVKRFKALKPLIEMTPAERTLEKVQKVAAVVRKHPATVYRWIEAYER